MKKYKFLFCLRGDAAFKSGGDIVQARHYKEVLEKNFDCEVVFYHEANRRAVREIIWDVVIVFNVSRLQENYSYFSALSYHRIILCPIVQPGFCFSFRLTIKNFIRGLLGGQGFLAFLNNSPLSILEKFDGFVFLSKSERLSFHSKFSMTENIPSVIYCNGVSENISVGVGERVFDFIVVGRVEPKKCVVELIDSVNEVRPDALLLCVGGVNWYHPIYSLKFYTRVLKGQVVYLGKRNPETVYGLMRQTKTLLNFSELEVSPLVDLEALASGCRVVSTIYSYTHLESNEWFLRIDVKDSSQRELAISNTSNDACSFSPNIPTWSENAHDYIAFINSFLKLRATDDA